jgi:hypothetical protein
MDPPLIHFLMPEREEGPSGQMGNRYVEPVELGAEGDDFSLLLGVDSLFVSLFDSPFDSLLDSADEDFDPLPSPFDFPLRA